MKHTRHLLHGTALTTLILWAAIRLDGADYAHTDLQPHTGLTAFEYMEAPDRLPNYTAGARWGTQGDPIRTMQKPLTPEASQKHLVTFPAFDIDLFASEPDIIKPLWLAFDHRGRLWIAESVDYPNQLQPEGQGRDRLKILEDTNGDGQLDRSIVFADKLSIPTSFVFYGGGVIVVHSGRMEWLKDTNGDDRADVRETLITGWGTQDTHATVSNLRYGFDNWIWGVVGYSGFRGTVGGKELRFGQGIFRFKPDGSELEFIRSSNNNTWGLDFTEENIVIGSTANGNASMYMPIPNRYYEAVNGWSAARLESIASSQNFYPITEKVRQVDWHGKYTAGSGSALYTARSFPKPFWNRAQFVAEPTGHLLGLFFLEARGADYHAHNARNMLASDDEWTAPIYGEVGPDGALWVVDWYNYIVQHNPTPIGFETGKGNAYDTSLRDKTRGRIYRVVHREGTPSTQPVLDPSDPDTLLKGLTHDNKLWRLHAQRLLVERGQKDIIPELLGLVKNPAVDALGLNPAAIHALWTLEGLGALEAPSRAVQKALTAALDHPSAGVRRAAVMVAPKSSALLKAMLRADLANDDDAQVRLATLLALAEMPADGDAAKAILGVLESPANAQERWIMDAATAAAATHDADFLQAFLGSNPQDGSLTEGVHQVLSQVTSHYAARGPINSVVSVLQSLKQASPELSGVVLDGLLSGWPEEATPDLSRRDRRRLEGLMDDLSIDVQDRLLSLGRRWQVDGLFAGRLEAIVESLESTLTHGSAEEQARMDAAGRWLVLQDEPEVISLILHQIEPLGSPTLSAGMLTALQKSQDVGTAEAILKAWPRYTPAVQRSAIATLLRRPEWALVLLDAISEGSMQRSDVSPEYWSQLRQHPSRRVAGFARRLADADTQVSSDRQQIVEAFLPLAQEKGNAQRGQEVFESSCAICHKIDGKGGAVGPELTGIGSRDRADILLEIMDPNRSVEANYRLWSVSTKDGNSYSGRLEAETRTTVEILDLTGQKHVIQRKEIETLEGSNLSIMPVGFEALPKEDIKALLEYLASSH